MVGGVRDEKDAGKTKKSLQINAHEEGLCVVEDDCVVLCFFFERQAICFIRSRFLFCSDKN